MSTGLASVSGVRHRRGGGASLADRTRNRGVGSLFRLDQYSRLSGGFYGVGVGGGLFHAVGGGRDCSGQTSCNAVAHGSGRARCASCYRRALRRVFGGCRGRESLAGSAGWRGRRNCWSICGLSSASRAGAGAPRSRFRDRDSGGPDRNRARIVSRVAILNCCEALVRTAGNLPEALS